MNEGIRWREIGVTDGGVLGPQPARILLQCLPSVKTPLRPKPYARFYAPSLGQRASTNAKFRVEMNRFSSLWPLKKRNNVVVRENTSLFPNEKENVAMTHKHHCRRFL